jgi:hypothetical protein
MKHLSTPRNRAGSGGRGRQYRLGIEELEDRLAPVNVLGPGVGGPLNFEPPGSSLVAAADPSTCPPTQETVSGSFTTTPVLPILNHPPLLQATLAGSAGTFQGRIIFQPISVPPIVISDGCQENSRFTVQGFVGSLTLTGEAVRSITQAAFGIDSTQLQLQATEPINASLQLHFGTQTSKPLFTFQSDRPVTVQVLVGTTLVPVGTVQFVQIVGGQVVQVR